MQKKAIIAIMLPILCLLASLSYVNAIEITSCVLDSEVYLQGQSGYAKVDIYNNMDDKIRVTQTTMMIDYFYTDGTVYRQTWYTNSTLPVEILQTETNTFYIPFTLPSNIAPGYITPLVRVMTDLWNTQSQRWYASDNPTAEPTLYIESPYKQQFEDQQTLNEQLQEDITELESSNTQLQAQINELSRQLEDLQTAYYNTTILMYVFIAIAAFLAILMTFLMKFTKRNPSPATR